jgi:hypothetical protein
MPDDPCRDNISHIINSLSKRRLRCKDEQRKRIETLLRDTGNSDKSARALPHLLREHGSYVSSDAFRTACKDLPEDDATTVMEALDDVNAFNTL